MLDCRTFLPTLDISGTSIPWNTFQETLYHVIPKYLEHYSSFFSRCPGSLTLVSFPKKAHTFINHVIFSANLKFTHACTQMCTQTDTHLYLFICLASPAKTRSSNRCGNVHETVLFCLAHVSVVKVHYNRDTQIPHFWPWLILPHFLSMYFLVFGMLSNFGFCPGQ